MTLIRHNINACVYMILYMCNVLLIEAYSQYTKHHFDPQEPQFLTM